MKVRIVFLDDKTWDLYLLNERQSHWTYKQIQKYYDNKLISWGPDGKAITIEPANIIKLKEHEGVYKLPVRINNVITLDFILDLGASDVSLSKDVFLVLYKAGTIDETDFIGNENYQLADGSIIKSSIFNLKTLTIGEKQIKNVRASISKSTDAPLLLGQSALKKLNSYKIDVSKTLLIIN